MAGNCGISPIPTRIWPESGGSGFPNSQLQVNLARIGRVHPGQCPPGHRGIRGPSSLADGALQELSRSSGSLNFESCSVQCARRRAAGAFFQVGKHFYRLQSTLYGTHSTQFIHRCRAGLSGPVLATPSRTNADSEHSLAAAPPLSAAHGVTSSRPARQVATV
jgi:hypothetical protein